MAKDKAPEEPPTKAGKAGKGEKGPKQSKVKQPKVKQPKVKGALLDRLTSLVVLLFLASLVAQQLTG